MTAERVRHILGLSGGKDSAALAVYLRDRIPEMEYIFTDTQKELPETYEYLAKLEAYLGKPIARLNADRGFDHWLEVHGNYLPSPRSRWCTRVLKLVPFERYVGDGPVVTYIGIRADEDRDGYISTKENITARFPFKEDGIKKADVLRILDEAGLGLPDYYKWRSRSGCYFCFFQRKNEWLGLKGNHPELFEEAKSYEKTDLESGKRYTWQQNESLEELENESRARKIRDGEARKRTTSKGTTLVSILGEAIEPQEDDDESSCLICHL
ncbi:MAG TPA: phosphoadenosine phosphosulfate reductase family protein [Candidatus Limnocylindrales bacterium]|nr:phosphoadenosine phosphosulfate reductase family protein [Candidatus Limnocylindrales bacterium]